MPSVFYSFKNNLNTGVIYIINIITCQLVTLHEIYLIRGHRDSRLALLCHYIMIRYRYLFIGEYLNITVGKKENRSGICDKFFVS